MPCVRTFVLPRGAPVLFTSLTFRAVRSVLRIFARPSRGYEARDRVMALYAPLALIAFPVVCLVVLMGAFACFFEVTVGRGWREALTASGSSLFTLGFERPPGLGSVFISFAEAAIGLGLLAVLIAYLPTIYSSFSTRETMVTQLSVRAGTPPTAWRMLELAHRAAFLDDLDRDWQEWMRWFSAVSETHTSLAVLPFFRSPNPNRSWITSAGTVMDAAALRLAVLNIPFTAAPGLCIRSGFMALREIADFFGFEHDADPAPDDPISIDRRRVHRDLRGARRSRSAGEGRPRARVARLRGMARELRPRAARAVQPRDGAVRAVVVGSFADGAAPESALGTTPPRGT